MFVLKFKISTRPAQLTDVQVGSPPLRWGQTIFVQKRFFSNCFISLISILECQLTSKILLTGGHPCPTCSFIFNWETGEWKKTVLSSYLLSILIKFSSIICQIQAGDLGEGRSSHGCASYISPEVNNYNHHCLHQGWADDLKSGQRCASFSCRRLVWTQHTNSGGEKIHPQWFHQTHVKPKAMFWLQVFNPATEMWRVVGDLTSPRRGLTLVVKKWRKN